MVIGLGIGLDCGGGFPTTGSCPTFIIWSMVRSCPRMVIVSCALLLREIYAGPCKIALGGVQVSCGM